jgi:hypothetical protein
MNRGGRLAEEVYGANFPKFPGGSLAPREGGWFLSFEAKIQGVFDCTRMNSGGRLQEVLDCTWMNSGGRLQEVLDCTWINSGGRL